MPELQMLPEQLPAHVLAYIGDAVYELYVRTYLVNRGYTRVNQLHKEAVRYVNAATQSQILHSLEETLSEEEMKIVRRGRNAKFGHVPKNADMIDYRYATAFESLAGFLYLRGEEKRLKEIFQFAVKFVENPGEVENIGKNES